MNDRPDKLETLFHAALDLPPEKRAAYLALACQDNAALRERIQMLLQAATEADPFFQKDPLQLAGANSAGCDGNVSASLPEGPGAVIGRYKLLQKIGEGGMGVVYMAEQREPVVRKVALKIIKLGMDTRSVVARFEAERQALAMMDHVNIARVLDGGATESGRPYFVMEMVQGVPITEFCDKNHLCAEERIKLFIPVCQAIQSAHQKGIIHRDIKPSNVLVTLHDGVPVPKVIDFGVAKAINQKLTEKTLYTNFATMIGTPAYMSPEQAEMSGLDIDTRSDIYGLGVLLYELLTSTTPFPEKRLRSVAYSEMQRIIVEEEPERPSTRLTNTRAALAATERGSKSEIGNPKSEIDSDLDWIVMKCLEKDRSRRYESASALAADSQRHLRNEPVLARPPSLGYRLRKAVQRNKTPFAAAALVVATLVVAAVASTWQSIQAKRERKIAQEQAQIARAVKDFLVEQMLAFNPFWGSKSLISEEKRALVDRVARAVEVSFASQPLTRAEIHLALAASYVGVVDRENSAVQAQKALEIRQHLLPAEHSDTLHAAAELAEAYMRLGLNDQAEKLLTEWLRKVRPSRNGASFGEAWLLYEKGSLLRVRGQSDEALPYLRQSMAILNRTLGSGHIRSRNVLWHLAATTQEAGRAEEAEGLWREGVRESERDLEPEHFMTIQFKKGLAYFLLEKKESSQAQEILEQILPVYHRIIGPDHNNALDAEGLLAQAHEQQGHIDEAARIYANLHPRWARHFPYATAFWKCWNIAQFFSRHGRIAEAKAAFDGLRSYFEAHPPELPDHFEWFLRATAATQDWPAAAELCRNNFDRFSDSLNVWLNKAWIFRYVGDEESYQRVVSRVLALAPSVTSTNDQHVPIEIAALGSFGFSPEQVKQLDSMMASLQATLPGRSTNQQVWGYRAIGQMQLQLGRLDRCLKALEQSESQQVSPDPYTFFIRGMCLHRLERPEDARTAFEKGESLSEPRLRKPLGEFEGFLPAWQVYQQLLMRREAAALLASATLQP